MPETRRVHWFLRILPLLFLSVVVSILFATGATRYLSLVHLVESRDWLAEQMARRPVLSAAAFFTVYVLAAAMAAPFGALFTISGGFLFGGLAGAALSLGAAALGGTILFLVARMSLGEILTRKGGRRVLHLRDGFHKNAVPYLLFLRLTPAFPFFLVNIAMAMTDLKLRTFVWVTAIGLLPATIAYALAGAGLDKAVAAQRKTFDACMSSGAMDCKMNFDLRHLVTMETLLALSALGVLALLPVLIRRTTGDRSMGAVRRPDRR